MSKFRIDAEMYRINVIFEASPKDHVLQDTGVQEVYVCTDRL